MTRHANCKCEEAYIGGIRLEIDTHDCDYVEARNKLTVTATMRANTACEGATQNAKWAREFHKAMNQLAYEARLVKYPPRSEGVEFAVPVKLNLLRLKKFAD